MSAAAQPPIGEPVELTTLAKLGRRDWIGGLALAILAILAVLAVFGPLLAPDDPSAQDLGERLIPPVWSPEGSFAHVLGTDQLGRDVLSRLIVGARLELLVGFVTAALELAIGVTLGLIAGFRGGRAETLIMRLTDVQMGFPGGLMTIFLVLLFGSSVSTLILAIGLNGWMIFARLTHGEVRQIKNEPYVHAARVTGMSSLAIVRRHVIPHLRSRVVALYFLEVPRVVLVAAGLSFLGLGVTPPDVTWGIMIGDSRTLISVAYWPGVFAGLAIVVTVASLYVFASWIEPRIDPLRRRSR